MIRIIDQRMIILLENSSKSSLSLYN